MIHDTNGLRMLSAPVAVEQGTSVEGSFKVECNTGYALSIPSVDDATCEIKHSAAGSWTSEGGSISLTPWNGTTQTFNYRVTADASAIYKERLLPLRVGKSTVTTDFSAGLETGSLLIAGQNLVLTLRREILTLGELVVTGQEVTFTNRRLAIDAGTLALSGQSVDLLFDQPNVTLGMDAGALTLTGQNVDLQRDLLLGIDAGSVAITGQDVTLTFGGGADSDATAFLTAAGLTGDATISAAIDALVVSLKSDGIWTKCYAIYPFVGGTASTHKWNLKDPEDNDASFRLTFAGTWTHNANGITNAGGYPNHADTKLTPTTTMVENDTHLAIYNRNNTNGGDDIGTHGSGNGRVLYMSARTGGNFEAVMSETGGSVQIISVANANSEGFYIASRRSSTDFEAYKNGASIGTYTTAESGALPQFPIFIGDRNFSGSGLGNNTTRNYAFASIGSGLTDTEAANYTTAVEAFQDALSRGVV